MFVRKIVFYQNQLKLLMKEITLTMLNIFLSLDLTQLLAYNVFSVFLGHLHAGNVVMEGGNCRLLDLENWLLGLPSYYRSFFTQFKKINVRTLYMY